MFYNNGIIFQSTFEQEINIPKLGESLAEALAHMKQAYKICNYPSEDYIKIIFETEDISMVIIKLGEDSNLALFFRKEELKEINLTPIRRYITRIEELIDMDKRELVLQELLTKEEESKRLQNDLQIKLDQINNLQEQLKKEEQTISDEEQKRISKEVISLYEESIKKREIIDHINVEISELKEKIESEKKKE